MTKEKNGVVAKVTAVCAVLVIITGAIFWTVSSIANAQGSADRANVRVDSIEKRLDRIETTLDKILFHVKR